MKGLPLRLNIITVASLELQRFCLARIVKHERQGEVSGETGGKAQGSCRSASTGGVMADWLSRSLSGAGFEENLDRTSVFRR